MSEPGEPVTLRWVSEGHPPCVVEYIRPGVASDDEELEERPRYAKLPDMHVRRQSLDDLWERFLARYWYNARNPALRLLFLARDVRASLGKR